MFRGMFVSLMTVALSAGLLISFTGRASADSGKCGDTGYGYSSVEFYTEAGYVAHYRIKDATGDVWSAPKDTSLGITASADLTKLGLKDNALLQAHARVVNGSADGVSMSTTVDFPYCQGANRTAKLKTWGTIFNPSFGWQ